VLARSLPAGATLGELAIGRVIYKPGDTVAVHYEAVVGGVRHDAVATCIAGVDLAARARMPRYSALADRAGGRSPAAAAISYDDEAGALLSWLPFDPRLPALAEDGRELARRLGIALPDDVELVGYKPRSRAVLRGNGHVLKAYGAPRSFEAALTGLTSDIPLPTAAFAGAVPELRLTAQRSLAGAPPAAAADVAARAGAMVAALQRAPLTTVPEAPPLRQLDAAIRKADVIAAVLPALRPRVEALIRRLADALPPADAPVPAHGDFHADQLLVAGDAIAVIDLDQLCLADPALDLATYAADVVRGRAGDRAAVERVLELLLEGYGARPAALEWHVAAAILGRAAHPFQRQLPGWPERVDAMVAAAEAHL